MDTTDLNSDLLDMHMGHLPCFAHTLQLVIRDFFKQAGANNKVLGKYAVTVSSVRRSIHASGVLQNEKRLQVSNATRWNSQLARQAEARQPTDCLWQKCATWPDANTDSTWRGHTIFVQGEKAVTGSLVTTCIRAKQWVTYMKNSPRSLWKPWSNLLMSTYEKRKTLLVASALEPRFKLQWCNQFESTGSRSFLLLTVKAMMYQSGDTTKEDKQPQKKRQRGFFGAIFTASSDSTEQGMSDHQLEINDYLSTPCLPGDATHWPSGKITTQVP